MPLNDDSRPTTPPQVIPATSSSGQNVQKADQIAHRAFIKFLLIISASRTSAIQDGPRSAKIDKWFNLETPDTDIHRDHMRVFRTISALSSLPTLTLHVVLLIPDLGTNRALVAVDALDTRLRIEPTPRAVLLETWTLAATPSSSGSSSSLSSSESGEVSLAAVYKHAISLFRSLYTLCRQLPAAKLFQRYRQRAGVPLAPQSFGIELRLQVDNTVLTFDASPSPSRPVPLQTSTHAFPALSTPLGALKIAVRYLSRPNFRIDTIESLISSRLFNQDAGQPIDESVVFTPTVLAHRQRDSAASSPGSGAMAIRSSRVPASSGPRHSRTISFPAVTGPVLPSARISQGAQGVSGSGSGSVSDYDHSARLVPNTSSPRVTQFRPESLAFATSSSLGRGTPVRVGRESLDAIKTTSVGGERSSPGTSSSPPSGLSRLQPGASPRTEGGPRPPVISAFRSSTLVPSGLNSPSTSLRSIGLGTPGLSRPPSSLPHAIPETTGASNSRPWPTASSSPQSGGLAFPSNEPPPFASTSVPRSGVSPLAALLSGTPRSGDSNSSGGIVTKTPGKRYSSSFGHRRAPSAGTGTGTPGSITAAASTELASRRFSSARPGASPTALLTDLPPESPRPSNALLEPTENEENLSEFIREIDNARLRRLSGPRMSESHSSSSVSSSGVGHVRRVSLAERRQSPLVGRLELPPPASPRSPPSRLQELNLTDPDEKDDEVANSAVTGRIGMQISANPAALGMQLQNMDDQFKKTFQGLKDRRRVSTAAQPSDDRQATTSGTEAADASRRPGPSFLTGGVRDYDRVTTDTEPGNTATPGDASDGSGYAGIVGRLDLDSPELRTQSSFGLHRPHQQPHQLQQPTDVAYTTIPSGLSSTAAGNISRERAAEIGRRSEDEGVRYEGDNESAGTSARPERGSKYTPMLRRDGTLRADPSRTSSASTTQSDPSRGRRAATGWTGSSSPPTQ